MSKTLFHSELKGMGPVRVTVKRNPQRSKYAGKPDYVVLEIDGQERHYNCENANCAKFFEGMAGRTFTIIAEGGGKDDPESATIEYVGESAAELEPAEHPRPPKQPLKKPISPPVNPDDDGRDPEQPSVNIPAKPAEPFETRLQSVKLHSNKIGNLYLVALATAKYISTQAKDQLEIDMTTDQFQACASSIFIQLARDNMVGIVPGGLIELKPKQKSE